VGWVHRFDWNFLTCAYRISKLLVNFLKFRNFLREKWIRNRTVKIESRIDSGLMLNKPLAVRRDYSGSCNHVRHKIGKTWRRIKTTTKPGISVSSPKNGRNEIFGRSDQPLARDGFFEQKTRNAEFVTSCISNGDIEERKPQSSLWTRICESDRFIYTLEPHQKGNLDQVECGSTQTA